MKKTHTKKLHKNETWTKEEEQGSGVLPQSPGLRALHLQLHGRRLPQGWQAQPPVWRRRAVLF